MKSKFSLWAIWGFATTALIGTLLHFLYEWTNESLWAALISGVNESTWEHMKLLFVPMLVFAIVQSRFIKERDDFWCVKLKSILLGLVLIPVLFYTYNGVIGKSPDFINIAIFFISAAAAYIYEARTFNEKPMPCKNKKIAIFLLCLIFVLFLVFTFLPPKINIFLDPVTNTFGL